MISFPNGLTFERNIAYIDNPNFLISKNTVFSNLLNATTNKINNENCIWFRNNGETWHTLYSIESGYKEITINGEKCIILMPHLIIHIGKNKFSKYEIDIYFKNNDCKPDEVIESFLKVDELDIDVKKMGYVEESSEIVNYLLSDYNFKHHAFEDNTTLQKSMNNQKRFFNDISPMDTKLSQMIAVWKKDIDDHINLNIIHTTLINQQNDYIPVSYSKKKFFMGVLFELMKHIKLGNKRYIVYGINCRADLHDSIAAKFKGDNILLYDFDDDKKVTLPLTTIIESKFRAHDNGKNIIAENSIKVGGYLNFNGDQSPHKIVDIQLDRDKYAMKLATVSRDISGSVSTDTVVYSMIEQPKNIYANDIYDLINITEKERTYPLFNIKGSIIATKKNSSKRYSLDEICDFIKHGVFYNKKENKSFRIMYDNFKNMLDRISLSDEKIKIDDKYDQYSYGFVPDSSYSSKQLIKLSDDLFIDTTNDFIHIASEDEDFDKVDISSFVVDVIKLPCILNGVKISDEETYISHLTYTFNRKIRITRIGEHDQEYNRTLNCSYITIDDMEEKKVAIGDVTTYGFFADRQISIDGLHIGQYGKIKNLGAVHGFKKSLWHGIKDFYERTFDGKKMVLFENNIAVHLDLIDIDYFTKTSLKVKKKNDMFLSSHDLIRIKNSAKRLSGNIISGFNCIKCEIF